MQQADSSVLRGTAEAAVLLGEAQALSEREAMPGQLERARAARG